MSGTPGSSRCGHCGGSVRPDAPWCTLCLTPTRPVSAPEPEAVPVFATRAGEIDPLTAPLELLTGGPAAPSTARPRHAALPTWPCAACSTENDLETTTCAGCGAGFLAAVVRDEPPLLVLPLVGDVTQWTKLHWIGAGVALLVVALLLAVVLGALLG